MTITIEDRIDTDYLDDALLERVYRGLHPHRLPKVVPAAIFKDVPIQHLRQWCVKHAVYQIVTEELVNWLAVRIKGKRAIEICAGHGTIGRALGIPMSDSYMQTMPNMRDYYAKIQQPVIEPPPDVLRMEGNDHVMEAKPEIVIGSWVSEKYVPGKDFGSEYGVDEMAILETGAAMIQVGNAQVHGYKEIMKLPHERLRLPWLFSRASDPSGNEVCVWEGRKS